MESLALAANFKFGFFRANFRHHYGAGSVSLHFHRTRTRTRTRVPRHQTICAALRGRRGRQNTLRPKLITPLEVRDENPSLNLDNSMQYHESTHKKPTDELSQDDVFGDNDLEKNSGSLLDFEEEAPNEISRKVGFLEMLEQKGIELGKQDEEWGAGIETVFLIYVNSVGEIERVSVDEDAIFSRCGIEPGFLEQADGYAKELANERIAKAKVIAQDIESGAFKPPTFGTVYKFIKIEQERSNVKIAEKNNVQIVGKDVVSVGQKVSKVGILKLSIAGFLVVYGCCFLWAVQKYLFSDVPLDGKEFDEETKRMMAKKAKARLQSDKLDRRIFGSEQHPGDVTEVVSNKERLDLSGEQERRDLAINTSNGKLPVNEAEFNAEILRIRAMAREARRIELVNSLESTDSDGGVADVPDGVIDLSPAEMNVVDEHQKSLDFNKINGVSDKTIDFDKTNSIGYNETLRKEESDLSKSIEKESDKASTILAGKPKVNEGDANKPKVNEGDANLQEQMLKDSGDYEDFNKKGNVSGLNDDTTNGMKLPMFDSKDSALREKLNGAPDISLTGTMTRSIDERDENPIFSSEDTSKSVSSNEPLSESQKSEPIANMKVQDGNVKEKRRMPRVITSLEEARSLLEARRAKQQVVAPAQQEKGGDDISMLEDTVDSAIPLQNEIIQPVSTAEDDSDPLEFSEPSISERENKIEYEKFRPPLPKLELRQEIENQIVTSESEPPFNKTAEVYIGENNDEGKINQDGSDTWSDFDEEDSNNLNEETDFFDWTKDEALREVVMKVHSNEEAGKEPFDGLSASEEDMFYGGIQKRMEHEGERVSKWIDERVENLDYGKDVIGCDDPPEAYIAKWKDPAKLKNSHLYEKLLEDRKKLLSEKMNLSSTAFSETQNSTVNGDSSTGSVLSDLPVRDNKQNGSTTSTKTQSQSTTTTTKTRSQASNTTTHASITSSKSTESSSNSNPKKPINNKKWNDGFKKLYESEKDPKRKAMLKDIGQDLDSWVTDEEREEARKFFEESQDEDTKKYDKLEERMKYERERFGREAMLKKYTGYKSENKDHLWWMKLPYVLCIALYRMKDGEEITGLYSLEMMPMIQSKNKHFHVIAFEDRTDANNFCHLLSLRYENEELTNAVVLPRHPKEIYEEAKEEGYSVTILKRSQVEMSVDQPLEEIESIITEIGSAVYYDEMLQDNIIDLGAVLDNA